MTVATARIGLPDFHQRMGDRLAVLIADPTGNQDALADRQATVIEIEQQVVVVRAELQMRKVRDLRSRKWIAEY